MALPWDTDKLRWLYIIKSLSFPLFLIRARGTYSGWLFAGWVEEGGICISTGYLSRLTVTGELLVIRLCTPIATALQYVSFYCQGTLLLFGGPKAWESPHMGSNISGNEEQQRPWPASWAWLYLHFYESGFLVLSDNKWRIWRSKVIWFLKESCDLW